MTTIAQIAAEALDGVSLDITDAVPAATLTRTTNGAYDADNDVYSTTAETWTGRAVFCDMTAAGDIFPAYVVGPSDELLFLEGFTSVLKNDVLTIGARDFTVMEVQDIGGAGSIFYAVAQ